MPFPFPFTMFGANRSSNTPSTPSCDFTYCYGGDWVQGKVGRYGLDFDGTDGYVVLSNLPASMPSNKNTVAGWIKFDSFDRVFLDWYADDSNLGYSGVHSTGNRLFAGSKHGGVWNSNTYGSTALSTGTWYHIAMVDEGTTLQFYVNGVAETMTDASETNSPSDVSSLTLCLLGASWYGGAYQAWSPWDGQMDEVAIWDVALTSTEVAALYNSGSGARADSITPPASDLGSYSTDAAVGTYAFYMSGSSDAVGQYLAATSNLDDIKFDETDSFSVSIWAKTPDDNGAGTGLYPGIVSFFERQGLSNFLGWRVYRNTDNKIAFDTADGAYPAGFAGILSDSALDDNYHHIAVTFDTGDLKMYIDGTLQADTDTATDLGKPTSAASYFAVGAMAAWYYNYPARNGYGAIRSGTVDDAGLWNVALDQTDINLLYNSGVGAVATTVSSSNLLLYWNFEDGPGNSTITDQSIAGNTHNGSFVSMNGGTALTAGATGSLLMYYDFEIGDSNPVSGNFPTSTTVYDVDTVAWKSPTMHTGTMTNMTQADFGSWDQGKLGKYSLNFPGGSNSDRVVVSTNSLIEFGDSNSFSVACWVKSVDGSNYPGFVSKNWTDGAGNYKGWILGQWGTSTTPTEGTSPFTNKMFFSPRDGVAGDRGFLFTDNTVLDNDWHHLAATRNGTTKLSELYLDGVLQSDTSTKAMVDTGDDLLLGQYYNYSLIYCLDGNLDEVSIWSGSLSQANITSLAAGAKANAITASSADAGSWSTGANKKIGTYGIDFNPTSTGGAGDGGSHLSASWDSQIDFDQADPFSWSFWFKADNRTGFQTFMCKANSGTAKGFWCELYYTDGRPRFIAYDGSSQATMNASDLLVPADTWTHMVCTYDGLLGAGMKIYINATASAQSPTGTPLDGHTDISGGRLYFGARENEAYNFDGKMDDIAIFDVELDAGAITELYESGSANIGALASNVSSSALKGYWDFESPGPGSTTISGIRGLDATMDGPQLSAGSSPATLTAYYDMECDGPGSANLKDLSGNDLSGTLTIMPAGTCGSG